MAAGTAGRESLEEAAEAWDGAGQPAWSHLAFQDSEVYLGTAGLDTTPRAPGGISPQYSHAATRIGPPKGVRTMFTLRLTSLFRVAVIEPRDPEV